MRLLCPHRAWLLCVTAALLIGCGDGSPYANHEPDTLVIAVQDDARSLDPHAVTDAASMRMIENLYSTLLRYGTTYGDLEPDLAQSIDIAEDRLTYTITLVPNATFASGRTVVSADVAYSIQRIVDLTVRAQHFEAVEAIETPDDRTVILRLAEPVAPLRTYLAYPMNAIVDRQVVEQAEGRLDQVDAGSGPFRLDEWRKDQHLRLRRHEGYHVPQHPRLQRIEYRPMADETARTTALRTGEVHLVLDVAERDIATLDRAPGVRVQSVPGTFWEYIGLNCRRPPLDDARVRRAVAWAVDRAMVSQLVKFGHAQPLSGGHLPPNHWAHAALELYPHRDADKARQLLEEAGHEGGLELELKVGSAFDYQVKAAQVIQQQLAEVGITVNVTAMESGVFFDALGRGDFDMTVVGWVGFVDPDEWLWNLFHSQGRYNQQGYANVQLDALLDDGRRVHDRQQRRSIYTQAQQLVAHDAPMVFLYVNPQTTAMRDSVQGFTVHPTASTIFLRDAWVEQP